ncbi:hypothetical protein SLEP1_g619 [Rubroshorea leprosula]|uniref:Uncharacterized protein n=1 Tax=Rubroshorea leprosula TaxID=152421 RepID=A0AAV5HFU6_9ROSI|nr:hypothetical protein SLEP1_g619 [Rubroshorea leprosula]
MANSGNKVADDSISDSNINNHNNCILQKTKAFGAREIWDFAKSIGAMATGKEEEVLKRLEQFETRDGRQQVEDPSRKQRNGIAGEGGDFNFTKPQKEIKGCKGVQNEMVGFEEFLSVLSLIDLPMIGRRFTWCQPNGNAMSRLDRFLLLEDWLLKWKDMK